MIAIHRSQTIPYVLTSQSLRRHKTLLRKFHNQPASKVRQQKAPYLQDQRLNASIIHTLKQAFRHKCAYCETPIPREEGTYDHYRPMHNARGFGKEFSPNHYWWLGFEWTNLYLCCETCNVSKSSWFPLESRRAPINASKNELRKEKRLLIDPCSDNPRLHLTFDAEGMAIPLTRMGNVTISTLSLNRSSLVSHRKNEYEEVSQMLSVLRSSRFTNPQYLAVLKELLEIFDPGSGIAYQGTKQAYVYTMLREDNDYLLVRLLEYGNSRGQINHTLKKKAFTKWLTTYETAVQHHVPGQAVPSDHAKLKKASIDKIIIRNFKSISSLTIQYPEIAAGDKSLSTTKIGEPWLMILGENGVGKSSILQAIFLTLAGQTYINKLRLKPSDFLRKGERSGSVRIEFRDNIRPAELTFSKQATKFKASLKGPFSTLLGYGSTRLLHTARKSPAIVADLVRAENLFDPTATLVNYRKWMFSISSKHFERVAITLKELMLLERKDVIFRDTRRKDIFVGSLSKKSKAIPIGQMSDGYKSVFALAIDIMEKLIHEETTMDVAEGIVLIDEIGTHLHPRWRMRIVSLFRKIFPKIQFVVSTHDPLCLKGIKAGEIIVLKNTLKNRLVAIDNSTDPATLRADQLLASELFGLSSTIDPEVEELFNEYYDLLSQPLKNLSAIKKTRLNDLTRMLKDKHQMGSTERESKMYKAIDQMMATIRFDPSPARRIKIEASTEKKLRTILSPK